MNNGYGVRANVPAPRIKGGIKLSVFRGDFLGFQLGNEHSYNVNVTRVSSNDRYNDALIPNFTDSTVQVQGAEGTYYFDTVETTKQFQVDFAFDNLSETELNRLRHMFGYKGLKRLIFDEKPDRYYMVRPTQPPVLSYLPFGEGEDLVYKGEGSVQFIAYYPYAKAIEPTEVAYRYGGATITNEGDKSAGLEITYAAAALESGISLSLVQNNETKILTLSAMALPSDEDGILINSNTQLIEGMSGDAKTGHLYNQYIASGDFIFVEPGTATLTSNPSYSSARYTTVYY